MTSTKIGLLLILTTLFGCQNPYNQLNEQYARGAITRTQYLDLWAAQKKRDEANAQAWAGINASLQTANQNMQAQTQQNIAQTQAMMERHGQRMNQAWEAFNKTDRESSPLPTAIQLATPGYWTGKTRYAADGTMYKEYQRPDGSIYWSP